MRDLREDLKVIEAATEGPWQPRDTMNVTVKGKFRGIATTGGYSTNGPDRDKVDAENAANTIFISEARTGWPHAINRALTAEARVRELEEAISKYLYDRDATNGVLRAVERKGLKPDDN